ncbi:MAG: carboxypeptidase-like regulatory domain-containing protein, partial [Bacteroidota bacterium]|nr:carboxypeptidase-like regulatory domain-containing protein [Bacteroidota bacterium]
MMKHYSKRGQKDNNIYFLFILIFLVGLNHVGLGQTGILKGQIQSADGKPLSYASIFNVSSSTGTVSNIDGNYFMELHFGRHEIEFSFLGFKRQQIFIDINKDTTQLNISLKKENYLLAEVVVGLDEDPAYEMIRQAIKARDKNLVRTGTFDASVYSKGIYKLL